MISREDFTKIVVMETKGEITPAQSKLLIRTCNWAANEGHLVSVETAMEALGVVKVEPDELRRVVNTVVAEHPDEWLRYVGGEPKLAGFLTGKVMVATAGNADGKQVAAMLRLMAEL